MVAIDHLTRTYPLLVKVFDNADQVGNAAADRICSLIFCLRNKNRDTLLGLAGGESPRPLYQALSRRREGRRFSFSTCHTFALDEYYPMAPSNEKCLGLQIQSAISSLNIHAENRHTFWAEIPLSEVDAHCRKYERLIADRNGIDFQLLGIGRNGHIGFNEPGARPSESTRLVHLSEQTRIDAASLFSGLQHVPHRGLTLGIGTILEAEEICLIATGTHKAEIVKQFLESVPNSALPASYLKTHPAVTVYLDRHAARLLPSNDDVMVIQ
jgi:glucosamine-6-phosphate deaminase